MTLKDTPYAVEVVDGPEYETVCMLGSQLLVSDLPAVAYAGHLCNRYGLDTVSAGSSIALACLLYERGLITADDTGGLALRWGTPSWRPVVDPDRPAGGLWGYPGRGTKRIAARYGAEDLAVHVNGLEPPAHDPRAFSGMGLVYATCRAAPVTCRETCMSSIWG